MRFWQLITRAFSSALTTITKAGTKAVTGPLKDISGAAKDVTGIRKDLVETKLAQYRLEEHESLIQKATLSDVKRYDERTRRVVRAASRLKSPRRLKRVSRLNLLVGWLSSRIPILWAIVCFAVPIALLFIGKRLATVVAFVAAFGWFMVVIGIPLLKHFKNRRHRLKNT